MTKDFDLLMKAAIEVITFWEPKISRRIAEADLLNVYKEVLENNQRKKGNVKEKRQWK